MFSLRRTEGVAPLLGIKNLKKDFISTAEIVSRDLRANIKRDIPKIKFITKYLL